MNIQYVAIISEMPDVPHVGPPFDGREIVPHGVSLVTRGSLPARPMGPSMNVGEAQKDVISATVGPRFAAWAHCSGTTG